LREDRHGASRPHLGRITARRRLHILLRSARRIRGLSATTSTNLVARDILLVDDSPTDVMIAKEALSMSELAAPIHVVTDGDEALEFLYRRGKYRDAPRPALILLDLNLPRLSGHEVLTTIKTDDRLKSIPVIVLTTSRAPNDVIKSYQAHANCYITKPVDFDQLARVILSTQLYWLQSATLPDAFEMENRDEQA
ncbi:MAG TPA: response regulator, partial [Steroidobacteraceae bacterium]|nr:response regulator [Steroidobacteraceae bacterium]